MGKFLGYCEECKKSLCSEHAYFYIDENNGAITNNSPYLCKRCYEKKYHKKILSDVEKFKNNLIKNFYHLKIYEHIENIKIDKLIQYIEKC